MGLAEDVKLSAPRRHPIHFVLIVHISCLIFMLFIYLFLFFILKGVLIDLVLFRSIKILLIEFCLDRSICDRSISSSRHVTGF
jgi:hypothetical protein